MGADNLQYICTQHAPQLNSNVRACVAQHKLYLLNDCSYISVFLRLFFRLSPYIHVRLYRDMTKKISRYIKNIAIYRISRNIAAALPRMLRNL